MKTITGTFLLVSTLAVAMYSTSLSADAIHSPTGNGSLAEFDIVRAAIRTEGRMAIFDMEVASAAGKSRPTATGKLAGSEVFSYVWPTSINSSEVGFEADAGILALAITAHADFDDTPLFDENGDNNPDNDGDVWHSHWVVLHSNENCGPGALAVVDIPQGSQPRLPATWPGLPILIDSPGWDPLIASDRVSIRVAFDDIGAVQGSNFDGVTAGLRVNESVHAPLLCVVNVFDVASGDLSLPGVIEP